MLITKESVSLRIKVVSAGVFWFAGFMERNGDIALRKPDDLCIATAQRKNKKAISNYFARINTCVRN